MSLDNPYAGCTDGDLWAWVGIISMQLGSFQRELKYHGATRYMAWRYRSLRERRADIISELGRRGMRAAS